MYQDTVTGQDTLICETQYIITECCAVSKNIIEPDESDGAIPEGQTLAASTPWVPVSITFGQTIEGPRIFCLWKREIRYYQDSYQNF